MENQFIDRNLSVEPILDCMKDLSRQHLEDISRYCSSPSLKLLTADYKVYQNRDFDPGLNIFTIISDQYRRENFHSDIIALLLNPSEIHGEGGIFLEHFLDYLGDWEIGKTINKANYARAVVERESSRIDISIKDPISMHAVIIENKMNNAPDMEKQIPRYHLELQKQGYTVDAVVYIVLQGNKQPNTHDWNNVERNLILPKIIPVAAYEELPKDLYSGWLKNCEALAKNEDTFYLIKQYNQLIRTIGGRNMNRPLMESFMQQMLIGDNYQTATGIRDMLEDLINYRRDQIIEYYKFTAFPYTKVGDWNNYAVLNDYWFRDSHFAIDIIVTRDYYQVQFFDRRFPVKGSSSESDNPALWLLEKLGLENEFHPAGLRFEKIFNFPSQEQKMYSFIDNILAKLRLFQKENSY